MRVGGSTPANRLRLGATLGSGRHGGGYPVAMLVIGALLTWVAAASVSPAAAPGQLEPVFWRQRLFFIPYRANPQDPLAADVEKVQLLVSRDAAATWLPLQEARPNVQGFSYHALADGQYDFAVTLTDRHGNAWPSPPYKPMLRVIVDTQPPGLELSASPSAGGQVLLRYEATDAMVRVETLRVEAQSDGQTWHRLALGPPDVLQPDRVIGQLRWKPPLVVGPVRFRATVEDRAGNPANATAETSLLGHGLPAPNAASEANDGIGPTLGTAYSDSAGYIPSAAEVTDHASSGSVEWPAASGPALGSGRGDDPFARNDAPPAATPPVDNAYAGAAPAAGPTYAHRTPAQFTADQLPPASALGSNAMATGSGGSIDAPLLLRDDPAPASGSAVDQGWAGVSSDRPGEAGMVVPRAEAYRESAGPAGRWVNSLTFDIDYDLETVGPWGVAKVELWCTRDGGKTWESFGVDADNRSPVRVSVPAAGRYGFAIVVQGANAAPAAPPKSGDRPELTVGVDLQAPEVELTGAEVGRGNMADHLLVRWRASDEHLESRPVGLFYATSADGPWTTIATDLENTGRYAWRLFRQVPEKFYLRIEGRDVAGNVGVHQTPTPVSLNLPQPTGRLRGVRPAADEAGRYRTAQGSRVEAP